MRIPNGLRNILILIASCIAFASTSSVLGQTHYFTQGPSGGTGGVSFSDWPNRPTDQYYTLRRILVRAGDRIDGIAVDWEKADRTLVFGEWHGGFGGILHEFDLAPGEYLIEVRGTYGSRIHSLQFRTNRRDSDFYGGNGGDQEFIFIAPEGYEIVGFFGRDGAEIDALGAIMRLRNGIAMQTIIDCASTPNWVRVRGEIENFPAGHPLCAMVLVNGSYMFTCNESLGRYDLTVPLDTNGQVTIFGFADSYQPYKEIVDALQCR